MFISDPNSGPCRFCQTIAEVSLKWEYLRRGYWYTIIDVFSYEKLPQVTFPWKTYQENWCKGKDWYSTHPWCNSCEVIHSLRQVQCRIKVRVRWSLTCTLLTGPAGLSSFYSACSWLLLSHAAAADVADDDISLLLHSLVSWLPAAAGSYWSEGWSCHLQATPEGPDSICTLQAMDTPHLLWINKTSLRE